MADLTLTRIFKAPRAKVWECWTQAEHLKKWFTPPPAETVEAIIDPRPGGRFFTVIRYMGQDMPGDGVILEAVPGERLAFTNLLMEGWRPATDVDLPFTATITLRDHPDGTEYHVVARHPNEEIARRHEEMGFSQGWGTAADQLGRLAETL
ncbi:SRPBCC family protein [Rubellimicrobium arenae]|uniref:SRPBCC family protein n=1 Tax=Rubellimicrobium arenae TaxID=2817372 RepID=UPI001B300DF7|nr:SRPBCC family protein [Rubellimicrobium arenae]